MSADDQVNQTMVKFGYPATAIGRYDHWAVMLRPKQVTLGSLVLVCRESATAFADISSQAFLELKVVVRDLEHTLSKLFNFDKINYLMLKMVDPHVHFHVLPRYAETRSFAETEFADHAWPGPPDIAAVAHIDDDTAKRLLTALSEAWGKG